MSTSEGAERQSHLHLVGQFSAWIWALGFLIYYYYSHDFIPLVRHFWTQALG